MAWIWNAVERQGGEVRHVWRIEVEVGEYEQLDDARRERFLNGMRDVSEALDAPIKATGREDQ